MVDAAYSKMTGKTLIEEDQTSLSVWEKCGRGHSGILSAMLAYFWLGVEAAASPQTGRRPHDGRKLTGVSHPVRLRGAPWLRTVALGGPCGG